MYKLDWINGSAEWVPVTIAELVDHRDFAVAVMDIPERKPEPVPYRFHTAFPYEGKHEKDKAKVYDEIMDEIISDNNARLRKFERTHYVRNDGHSIRKDARKSYFRRRDREWELDDRRPNYRKCGEGTIRRMRTELAESVRRSDYDAELMPDVDRHVGYNTVQRYMYNADKRMREIRAEVAEKYSEEWYDHVETYDDCFVVFYKNGGGYQYAYPDEYYNEQATWKCYEYMIRKYGMEYANKYAKGECY